MKFSLNLNQGKNFNLYLGNFQSDSYFNFSLLYI